MYGTIARLRVKPGAEAQLEQLNKDFAALRIPGFMGQYVYKMDSSPNEYYLVVLFQSKDAYFANADSTEQDARYLKFRALLESDPEWHDGEIVYSHP